MQTPKDMRPPPAGATEQQKKVLLFDIPEIL